jgi:DNA polymerase
MTARSPEQTAGAAPFVPSSRDLATLARAAATCRGCDLFEPATQTVFGAGARDAELVLVGEQPGDREDRAGRPFVGPAGRLLDEALATAGIARERAYVTNVVKHFKFEERGKRRIHQAPSRWEITACQPWFAAELRAVRPRLVVALGATAAKAILGQGFRVTRERGHVLDGPDGVPTLATVHPSAILRAGERRAAELDAFVADLRAAAGFLRAA